MKPKFVTAIWLSVISVALIAFAFCLTGEVWLSFIFVSILWLGKIFIETILEGFLLQWLAIEIIAYKTEVDYLKSKFEDLKRKMPSEATIDYWKEIEKQNLTLAETEKEFLTALEAHQNRTLWPLERQVRLVRESLVKIIKYREEILYRFQFWRVKFERANFLAGVSAN